jgi:hypothetical protein
MRTAVRICAMRSFTASGRATEGCRLPQGPAPDGSFTQSVRPPRLRLIARSKGLCRSLWNLAPIDFSGMTMLACLSFWFARFWPPSPPVLRGRRVAALGPMRDDELEFIEHSAGWPAAVD